MSGIRFDILTLFPEMFSGPFSSSILGRAQDEGRVEIRLWNIRDFAEGRHRIVDDAPYGGGVGLVLKPEPIVAAVEAARRSVSGPGSAHAQTLFLTAQGARFTQSRAHELTRAEHLILVCGRYEGIDARAVEAVGGKEISIGDFVLTGGELPAMLVVDTVTRLLPGVLGKDASAEEESFEDGLLEYPHYTRPETFRDLAVPQVLLSGDHEAVARWRRKSSLLRTLRRRPDLLADAPLTRRDLELLDEWMAENGERGKQDRQGEGSEPADA